MRGRSVPARRNIVLAATYLATPAQWGDTLERRRLAAHNPQFRMHQRGPDRFVLTEDAKIAA